LNRHDFIEILGSLQDKILHRWDQEKHENHDEDHDHGMNFDPSDHFASHPSQGGIVKKKSSLSPNRMNSALSADMDTSNPQGAVDLTEKEDGGRQSPRRSSAVSGAEFADSDSSDDESGSEWDDSDYEEQTLPWEDGNGVVSPHILFNDIESRAVLGHGSFGSVNLVQQKSSGDYFALKCMRRVFIVENGWEEMIENERKAMLELAGTSPFLLNLHNTYTDSKYVYLLLEVCSGGELYQHMQKQTEQRINERDAGFYIACVVKGLGAMHSRKIVYRDLKPENLLIDNVGYLKVADFGLAKKTTRTFTVCGTPEYMAPEAVLSRGHDHGADNWATGILLYELLHGFTPFCATSPMEIYEAILGHEEVDDLKFHQPISNESQSLIKALLHPKKARRLGSLKGGIDDITSHPFFSDIVKLDWDQFQERKLPAPFVPQGDLADISELEELDEDDDTEVDTSGWKPNF
jgi:hypothetical protein